MEAATPPPPELASRNLEDGGGGEGEGEGEWELRHDDDGFTYKILKKRRILEPPCTADPPRSNVLMDPMEEEKKRRDRKRRTLLKLKSQYQKEIDRWELLSSKLRAMRERTAHQLELQKLQPNPPSLQPDPAPPASNGSGSVIEELLAQAEAQEAIIRNVSNLCDAAEAMCKAQQEQLAESFIDLPIWSSSPGELLASLCDE